MRDLFDAWENGQGFRTVVGQPQAPVDEASMNISKEQLIAMPPALAKLAHRRTVVRAGLIRPTSDKTQWFVRCPSALAMIADLVTSGVPVSRALALYENVAATLDALGLAIALELATIKSDETRTAVLQRNRPRLGLTAATLLIAAIGESLPAGDTDRIRIGTIKDQR